MRLIRFASVLLFASAIARDARAEDLFEIQVFHARVTRQGTFGAELHSNYGAAGARVTPEGEASTKGVLFQLIEPSYGVARGFEIAAHLQHAFRPDGTVDWGGAKLRAMYLLTPGVDGADGWHLAINAEGGYMPRRFDANRWGMEVRPVVEWTHGALDIDFNPMIAIPFGAERPGVPELQPAVSTRYALAGVVSPSLEYYAQLGPVTDMRGIAGQRHYVFETLDVIAWPHWILHGGVGQGLTAASTKWIVTVLVGRLF